VFLFLLRGTLRIVVSRKSVRDCYKLLSNPEINKIISGFNNNFAGFGTIIVILMDSFFVVLIDVS